MYIAFQLKSYIKLFTTLITLMVIDQLKDTLARWLKSFYNIKKNVEAEQKNINEEKETLPKRDDEND